MSHQVAAILARSAVMEILLRERPWVAVDLSQGLRLLPLEDDDLDSLTLDFSKSAPGFTYLSPAFSDFCARHSIYGDLLYFETNYFGGRGSQAVALFSNGAGGSSVSWVGDGAINQALRRLGVIADPGIDEFESVGLSRHRFTADWKARSAPD